MKLLLHLLMLALLSGGSARVVDDFERECGTFFAKGISPTRFAASQYKQICQTVNGVSYFATFYDINNRIPVYSAYKFEGLMGCERNDNWHIEPQLDGASGQNMATEASVDEKIRGKNQALNGDYAKSGFDKGHLAPVFQANSQSCADATFTLTNAAPQNPSFNRGQWRILEENIAHYLAKQCPHFDVYIVTGVVPGKDKPMNNRVIVPSHFWTAFCCLDQNDKCQITRGFIGENNKNNIPVQKTVEDLEKELKTRYGSDFVLFDSSTKPTKKIKNRQLKMLFQNKAL